MQARQVMNRSLATCSPETSITEAAAVMRDLGVGDVLVTENGHLRGIVTDRDLVVRALADKTGTQEPVGKFMSQEVVVGEADWDLERIAEMMGQHQVRRLPILQDGKLVGVISLGDVARFAPKKHLIADSLRRISEPTQPVARNGSARRWLSLALPVAVVALGAAATLARPGRRPQPSPLPELAKGAAESARQALEAVNRLVHSDEWSRQFGPRLAAAWSEQAAAIRRRM